MANDDSIVVTNRDFLRTLFPGAAGRAWVTAFPDDPDITRDQLEQRRLWAGALAGSDRGKRHWQAIDENTFFVISTFDPDAEGTTRRRKALFEACHVIMIDDVGEPDTPGVKVCADALGLVWGVEPSYVLETSPGNCQWGLILKAPETRQWAVEQLQNGMIKKGLTADMKDPGMANVTRYCRLPEGVNTKAKHVKANGGEPWRHRMRAWEPTRRYTVEELAALFGIDLVEPEARARALAPTYFEDDPVLEALQDAGLVQGPIDNHGRGYHITCPWVDEHTAGRDDGAAYFRRGSVDEQGNAYPTGGFNCFHGHGSEKNVGHLIRWLENEGHLEREQRSAAEVFAGLAYDAQPAGAGSQETAAPGGPGTAPAQRRPERMGRGDVLALLAKNGEGVPLKTADNARIILTHDEEIPPIEFDDFHGHKTLARCKWKDVYDADLLFSIQERYGIEIAKTKIQDAADHIAHAHRYDPIREYLEALAWDGTPRLDTWLLDYAGADSDSIYTREAGRKVLLAAVARTFRPGTKFDCMLILEGPQGVGKSSVLRELCPDPAWFMDSHLSIGRTHKEAAEALRGKWIVEVAELAAFRGAATESLKAFLSQQQDDYRPAYGRETVSFPRRCVFFGTTNETEYLQDATGGRRFWPVRTTGGLRWAALREVRDQLWAEAVVAYQGGESLVLGHQAGGLALEAADDRYEGDAWDSIIDLYFQTYPDTTKVTSASLAYGALGIPANRMSRADEFRLGKILRRRGWTSKPLKGADGVKRRYWCPADHVGEDDPDSGFAGTDVRDLVNRCAAGTVQK